VYRGKVHQQRSHRMLRPILVDRTAVSPQRSINCALDGTMSRQDWDTQLAAGIAADPCAWLRPQAPEQARLQQEMAISFVSLEAARAARGQQSAH
jgi:hypothetical protein